MEKRVHEVPVFDAKLAIFSVVVLVAAVCASGCVTRTSTDVASKIEGKRAE